MEEPANISIKKEIVEKVKPSGSKEKPIEINEDEESSDGENSVIILDSDTEVENEPADGEGVQEDSAGDDEEDEDEDEDEGEDESEDSDSSVDSDSVNSVWSNFKEATGDEITTEAAEVKIVKKFEKAMYSVADNDNEKGRKILEKLLDDPLVSIYRIEDPDYEVLEEPPRFARMLQVFIAAHKNLAKLDPEQEVAHLCQVLAYHPDDSTLWFDVALKCVENGDINFAKYAFKKCECLKESLEAHATLLYLSCDYAGCLKVLKSFQEDSDVLNDKMKYIKYKIRSTSQYYKQLSDRIFEEDEAYAEITAIDQRKIVAFDERIEELQRKVEASRLKIDKSFETDREKSSVIPVFISGDQDLATVCTIFCDLFDRIHAHSHCRNQLIEITEWESRRNYLDVQETVEKIVDIVECVEELTEKVEENSKKRRGRKSKAEKKEYLANWRKRLFVEPQAEDNAESEANSTADEDDGEDEMSQNEGYVDERLPENDLAAEFGLVHGGILSISNSVRRKERTPPPSHPDEFLDADDILCALETKFGGSTTTILDLLESTLLLLSSQSSIHGALPDSLKVLVKEMYNRISLFSKLNLRKYHELNITLMELNSRKATELCVTKHISPFYKSEEEADTESEEESERRKKSKTVKMVLPRTLLLRFLWKYTRTELKDDIKLEYLYSMKDIMDLDDIIKTSTGTFAKWDVELSIEELEKKKRIESVKHLWKSRNYRTLIDIITNDIDFGAISDSETLEILTYWLQALEKLKLHSEVAELTARVLHFYLFTEFSSDLSPRIGNLIDSLFHKIQRVDFKKIDDSTVSTIGYMICVSMKKYKKLDKDWKTWKLLYEIVKTNRGNTRDYIEMLNKSEDPDAMPLPELDLLVKAHSVLGEYHCCAQQNYEFLLFSVDCYHNFIDDIPTLEFCYQKENEWLWNNVTEEVSQILFCLYGKYGRKRKTRDDHENGGHCATTPEMARRILPVVLVQPLPLYDDKEKLLHDVIELLNSKFPFLLKVSSEKQKKVDEFTSILQNCNSLEDVNTGLEKCRDDVDDNIQSLVWYAMALTAFRSNTYKEATKYSELYLLTEESVHDDRLRASTWGILARGSVYNLFQLDAHEIYEQWKWRIMPFRMAVDAQDHEPVPHFELATTLYQLASSLARFFRSIPKTDPRRNDDPGRLRIESRDSFDRSLELTKLGDDGSQPEHQWLCYFFTGKLEAKSAKWNIVKVVESFYEAACGCELAGFYYPQKVQTKKQTNFEPLEVHYQAYSAVYKYLLNNEVPSLDILRRLRILLKLMNDGHKVVKPSSSLFRVSPDVYSVVDEMIFTTAMENYETEKSDDSVIRSELVEELKEMCAKAFSLVTERFPHIKSYYRLAQISFERGNLNTASDHIYKHVFKRKKRDDGLFDNMVEISCSDINRNGSFNFHIERCLKLGVQIAQRNCDLHNIVSTIVTMINIIMKDDEEHVEKHLWKPVVTMNLTAMEQVVLSRDNTSTRSTPSPGPGEVAKKSKTPHLSLSTLRTELWKLWTTLTKCSKPDEELIRLIKAKTEVLIVHSFRSIEMLRAKMVAANADAVKKKNTLKRKTDIVDLAQPFLKRIAQQNDETTVATSSTPPIAPKVSALVAPIPVRPTPVSVGPYLPLSDSDDEIQCIEPPAKKSAPSTSTAIPPKPAPTIPKVQQSVHKSNVPLPKPGIGAKVSKPVVQKPSASNEGTSNAALLRLLGSMPTGNLNEQITQFILVNGMSQDESKRQLAAQALKLINDMQKQNQNMPGTSKSNPPPNQKAMPGTSKSNPPPTQAGKIMNAGYAAQSAQISSALKVAKEAQAMKQVTEMLRITQMAQNSATANMIKNLHASQEAEAIARRTKEEAARAAKLAELQRLKKASEAEVARRMKEARDAEARRLKEASEAAAAARVAKEAEARRIKEAKEAEVARRLKEAREAEARRAKEALAAKEAQRKAEKAKAEQEARNKQAAMASMLQAAQMIQSVQAAHAAQTAKQNETIAKLAQAQYSAQLAQALRTMGAVAAANAPNRPSTSNVPSTSNTVKTVPAKPQAVAAPKPIRPNLSSSNVMSSSVPSITVQPSRPTLSQNGVPHILHRPAVQRTIHRPVPSNPSISTAPHLPRPPPQLADPEQQSNESRANMIQFLNSITDPVQREQMAKTLLGNK